MNKNSRFFEIIRYDNLCEVWVAPANNPEGEYLITLGVENVPLLIASLKNFLQKENLA